MLIKLLTISSSAKIRVKFFQKINFQVILILIDFDVS